MQKLQANKNQGNTSGSAESLLNTSPGLRLGKGLNINPAKAGLTPATEPLAKAPGQQGKLPEKAPETLGATFANEIIRRMGEDLDAEGQPKDVTALRHSLGSTMDWMRERFGDETAAAAAGMIIQSTSSGVNEDTLGNGLLTTLKFIDRNFGIAAGDAVMDKYNTGINTELNNYFDNGKTELFFDAGAMSGAGNPSATQDLNSRFFIQAVQATQADAADAESLSEQLLESLKAELDKVAELQNLTTKLKTDFSPAQITPDAAVAAYEATPMIAETQLADMVI
ncbi:MAG: hypothetical protein JEY79_05860 [Pseudodesulfovibrio sp.]|nr:hypothetical protein [Pseudodesulfovibrio sp.]